MCFLSPFCVFISFKTQTSRNNISLLFLHGFSSKVFSSILFMDLKICSLNVRGVRDRRELFDWLRRKKFSIYMLQEVHCSEITIPVWSAEWG